MEKTMSDIIAFVRKAMENGLKCTTSYETIKVEYFLPNVEVTIYNSSYNYFGDYNEHGYTIETQSGKFTIIATGREELEYELLIKDVEEYEKKNVIEDLNNFFGPK